MSGLLTQFRALAEELSELESRWALVGALAVGIYAEPRTTRDIDVAVAVDSLKEQELLVQQLAARGYTKSQLLMHVAPTRRLGVRVTAPSAVPPLAAVDLLFSCTGIEAEVVRAAVRLEVFPGLFVPIACYAHVLAMKVLAQDDGERLRDRADVAQLLRGATAEQIEAAKEALQLIEQRGFNRGKDLMAEFAADLKRYVS